MISYKGELGEHIATHLKKKLEAIIGFSFKVIIFSFINTVKSFH